MILLFFNGIDKHINNCVGIKFQILFSTSACDRVRGNFLHFLGEDSDHHLDDLQVDPETSVEVFPNGTATQATTFTLVIGDYQRQVRLSRAGQVRMLAYEGGG